MNLAGLPALVLPCGFVEGGRASLPVGFQMIGAAFSEVGQIFPFCVDSFRCQIVVYSSSAAIIWWNNFSLLKRICFLGYLKSGTINIGCTLYNELHNTDLCPKVQQLHS